MLFCSLPFLGQGGEAWSKLACFTFRAHLLVCYCILNEKIAFKTLVYRADTDYWVCLCLKTHGWDNVHSVALLFEGVLRLSQLAGSG